MKRGASASADRAGRASPEPASGLGHTATIPCAWQDPATVPQNAAGLLHLGDSIPDLPHFMVGTRIDGQEAEELGYREFAKYGGWLIWHGRGDDFHVIDIDEPRGWMPLTALPNTFPPKAVKKADSIKQRAFAKARGEQ